MRNAAVILLMGANLAQASTQDCEGILLQDPTSRAAMRCVLDHPTLSRQLSPTRFTVFVGDGRRPTLEANHEVHLQPDGTRVMVRQEKGRGVRMGERVVVSVEWEQAAITYVTPGRHANVPGPTVTGSLLAVVDAQDNASETIAVYNHRTGALQGRFGVDERIRLLRFHNDLLLVGTDFGVSIWRPSGEKLWTARGVQPDGSLQVSADGEYLLVNQRVLHHRGAPRSATLPVPAVLVGDELFSPTHNGELWRGPVSDHASMPPGPAAGVGDFRLGRGMDWGWNNGHIFPEGAVPAVAPRRGRSVDPGLKQVVRLHSDAAGIVGAFVVGETGVAVDVEGLTGIDLALARMLQFSPRYVDTFELTADETTQRTVDSEQALRFVVGDDVVEIDAMPGVAQRQVRPQRFSSLPTRSRTARRAVQVLDSEGKPVAGARVYATDGRVLVADSSGSVHSDTRSPLWAVGDAGSSEPGVDTVLTLDHPRQRCHVVDVEGTALHGGWCDRLDMGALLFENLGRAPSSKEPLRATLTRLDAATVQIQLVPRLVLTGALDPSVVTDSYVVDRAGTLVPAQTRRVDGLEPGPVTWWVEIEQDVWCMEFDVGALDTRIGPAFRRCAAAPSMQRATAAPL